MLHIWKALVGRIWSIIESNVFLFKEWYFALEAVQRNFIEQETVLLGWKKQVTNLASNCWNLKVYKVTWLKPEGSDVERIYPLAGETRTTYLKKT